MENIKNLSETTVDTTPPHEMYATTAAKSFYLLCFLLAYFIFFECSFYNNSLILY